MGDELDLQIECTGSLHLSTMSSVPIVQPLDSHMHLEAKTSSKRVCTQSLCLICLHHVTVSCRHLLFWCFSDQDPLMHTGTEAWILSAHLMSSFEHHCADPTSHLPRLSVTSVPCRPAYHVAMEQICWAHFRTGGWSNAHTQKACPRCAVGPAFGNGTRP